MGTEERTDTRQRVKYIAVIEPTYTRTEAVQQTAPAAIRWQSKNSHRFQEREVGNYQELGFRKKF